MKKSIFKKKRFYALLVLVPLIIFVFQFSKFRSSDQDFIELFEQNGFSEYGVERTSMGGVEMRYVWAGPQEKPLLLMVHGSPSSSSFWQAFFEDSLLRREYRLAAVDRPGFGYSNFGKPIHDLDLQAQLCAKAIKELKPNSGVYVLASSYGGSVTAKLAMNESELIDGIVFQSSSLIPEAEKTYSFTHWTKGRFISSLLPTTIRMANEEKLRHSSELAKIQNGWSKIKAHIVFLHGSDDGLIYPINAFKAKEMAINAESSELKIFEGRGHDLYWTERPALIRTLIGMKKNILLSKAAW